MIAYQDDRFTTKLVIVRDEDKMITPCSSGVVIIGNKNANERTNSINNEDNIYRLWDKPNLEDSKSSVLKHYSII